MPDSLVPARAYETGCFGVFANYGGRDGDIEFLGESRIVGLDSRVAVETTGSDCVVITAATQPQAVAKWRRTHAYVNERRVDLFGHFALDLGS